MTQKAFYRSVVKPWGTVGTNRETSTLFSLNFAILPILKKSRNIGHAKIKIAKFNTIYQLMMKFVILIFLCYSNMSQLHVLEFFVWFCSSVIFRYITLVVRTVLCRYKVLQNVPYAVVKLSICWFFVIVFNMYLTVYDDGHVIYVVSVLRLKLHIKN